MSSSRSESEVDDSREEKTRGWLIIYGIVMTVVVVTLMMSKGNESEQVLWLYMKGRLACEWREQRKEASVTQMINVKLNEAPICGL